MKQRKRTRWMTGTVNDSVKDLDLHKHSYSTYCSLTIAKQRAYEHEMPNKPWPILNGRICLWSSVWNYLQSETEKTIEENAASFTYPPWLWDRQPVKKHWRDRTVHRKRKDIREAALLWSQNLIIIKTLISEKFNLYHCKSFSQGKYSNGIKNQSESHIYKKRN